MKTFGFVRIVCMCSKPADSDLKIADKKFKQQKNKQKQRMKKKSLTMYILQFIHIVMEIKNVSSTIFFAMSATFFNKLN